MRTERTAANIQSFFDALEQPAKPLTSWESGFVASIKDQFDRTGSLSEKQFEVLERIFVEKTD